MSELGLGQLYFVRHEPTSNKTMAAFDSTIQIRYTVPAGAVSIPAMSYLSVNVQAYVTTAAAVKTSLRFRNYTANAIALAPASLPIASMFDFIKMSINDKTVSQVEQYSMLSQVLAFTGETKNTLDTLYNEEVYVQDAKVYNINGGAIGANGAEATLSLVPSSYRKNYSDTLKIMGAKSRFNACEFVRYNHKLNIPLSNTDISLPPGSQVLIELNVSPSWRNNFFAGTFTSAADNDTVGVTWPTLPTSAALANSSVYADVENIAYVVAYRNVDMRVTTPISMKIPQYWSNSISLTTSTSQSHQLTLPIGAESVYFCFGWASTDQHTGFARTCISITDVIAKLQSFQITVGTQRHPRVPYAFNGLISSTTGNAGGALTYTQRYPGSTPIALPVDGTDQIPSTQNTRDVERAYFDYLVGCHSLLDSNGAPMTYDEWKWNPIFCWDLNLPMSDRSNSLQVDLTFRAELLAVVNTLPRLYTLAKYSSDLKMSYSSDGQLENVSVDQLI